MIDKIATGDLRVEHYSTDMLMGVFIPNRCKERNSEFSVTVN